MKQLIQEYNQKDSLLVISPYPKKGETYAAGMGGVASFTKNTLLPLASQGQKIVVLANKINGKKEIYRENNILVVRCWQRGSVLLFWNLFKETKRLRKIKKVLVEFEFALYDGLYQTLAFPLFLFLLKVWGKKTVLVLHQVIFDLNQLSGHLGWKKSSLITKIFSLGIRFFYLMMALVVERVVVLEAEFQKRLIGLGITKDKIKVIPHGIEKNFQPINQGTAKRLLGVSPREKLILVFGFLTWYKGSDLILKQFKKFIRRHPQAKIRLILAGGESPTQKDKAHYQKYLKQLYRLAQNCPRAEITGFVPQDKIPLYFSAADWVVLPYRVFMSSSGPLSLAITFRRPFLLSPAYSKILNGPDFQEAFKISGLDKNHLIWRGFNHLPTKSTQKKIQVLVNQIRDRRDFSVLARNYLELIEKLDLATLPSPAYQPATELYN